MVEENGGSGIEERVGALFEQYDAFERAIPQILHLRHMPAHQLAYGTANNEFAERITKDPELKVDKREYDNVMIKSLLAFFSIHKPQSFESLAALVGNLEELDDLKRESIYETLKQRYAEEVGEEAGKVLTVLDAKLANPNETLKATDILNALSEIGKNAKSSLGRSRLQWINFTFREIEENPEIAIPYFQKQFGRKYVVEKPLQLVSQMRKQGYLELYRGLVKGDVDEKDLPLVLQGYGLAPAPDCDGGC